MFGGQVRVLPGRRGAAPEQGIILCAGEAGELSADELEDFSGAAGWNQQAELARCAGFGCMASEVGARTSSAFNQTLSLEVAQRPRNRRSRDLKALDQLRLAGQATFGTILAHRNLSQQFT